MERSERLLFCKKCLNRDMDIQRGVVCKLTGAHAEFEAQCPDYAQDETVKEIAGFDSLEGGALVSSEDYEKLRLQQKPAAAIIAGLAAGLACAAVWGAVTAVAHFQIGWMAIGVGAGVGFAIRYFGRGLDKIFGIAGALIALLSCVIGNFLAVMGMYAAELGMNVFEVLAGFDYSLLPEVMKETFSPMDVLFYVLAVAEGYKLSFRKITQKDIQALRGN